RYEGHAESVSLLLDTGLSPDMADEERHTPLMLASEQHNSGMIRALLQRGADVRRTDREGWTALHWAVSPEGRGNHVFPVISALLAAGSDPNAQDRSGNTPLMILLEGLGRKAERTSQEDGNLSHEEEQCIRLLLQAGTDLQQKNAQGQ